MLIFFKIVWILFIIYQILFLNLIFQFCQVPPGEGYDHNLCVTKSGQSGSSFVAKVWHVKSGRYINQIY